MSICIPNFPTDFKLYFYIAGNRISCAKFSLFRRSTGFIDDAALDENWMEKMCFG